MKILIVNWRTKEEGLGGQESYFSDLSEILDARIISHKIADNAINYNLFPDDAFRVVYQGYVIDEYLENHEKLFKPDLIIKNSAVGMKELKTPQIIVFQDPYYSVFKKMMENKAFSNVSEHYLSCMLLQQWTAKHGKTVAVSNFMKRDMDDCGIKCDKVIEEGIDIEKFKPIENKEELKKAHNIPLDKKIGIAVTKFTSAKGYDILAKLINKFQDIYWIVIFTSEIKSKPKLKNVSIAEEVHPSLMPQFYNLADFFINTSPIESFGLSTCEAASCNLPVITYQTGFAWDWWDERLGIRVDNWKYEDFEEAVERISDIHYEPRKAIIERGFTKERMAKEWKAFVEKVIKK